MKMAMRYTGTYSHSINTAAVSVQSSVHSSQANGGNEIIYTKICTNISNVPIIKANERKKSGAGFNSVAFGKDFS